MSEERTLELVCPHCQSITYWREDEPEPTCQTCGSRVPLAGHLCPDCLTYHQKEEVFCPKCSAALIRICPICNTPNWPGSEYCLSCGHVLDVFVEVAGQRRLNTASRLNRQMLDAKELKAVEENASQKRMAELMAIEEARQVELRKRMAKQKQQERHMLILIFAAVMLFLLALAIFAAMNLIG